MWAEERFWEWHKRGTLNAERRTLNAERTLNANAERLTLNAERTLNTERRTLNAKKFRVKRSAFSFLTSGLSWLPEPFYVASAIQKGI
jgi:hypothetical protein